MRLAEFVLDYKCESRIFLPPDRIAVCEVRTGERSGGVSILNVFCSSGQLSWAVKGTYEEAVAEINAALVDCRPKFESIHDYSVVDTEHIDPKLVGG
jgi:hypothetical protein